MKEACTAVILSILEKDLCSTAENLGLLDQPVCSFEKVSDGPLFVLKGLGGAVLQRKTHLEFAREVSNIECKPCANRINFITFIVAQPRKQIINCHNVKLEGPWAAHFGPHSKEQEHKIVREDVHSVRQDNRRFKLLQNECFPLQFPLPRGNPNRDADRYYGTNCLEPSSHAVLVWPHCVTSQSNDGERRKSKSEFQPLPCTPKHFPHSPIFCEAS